jgi:hypothetical protein
VPSPPELWKYNFYPHSVPTMIDWTSTGPHTSLSPSGCLALVLRRKRLPLVPWLFTRPLRLSYQVHHPGLRRIWTSLKGLPSTGLRHFRGISNLCDAPT